MFPTHFFSSPLRVPLRSTLFPYTTLFRSKKLVVLGFSQGGVMAYSLTLANPQRFAAVAVLSSWLPTELVSQLAIGEAVQFLPTLVQHGSQDSVIEVARAGDSVERLRELGV